MTTYFSIATTGNYTVRIGGNLGKNYKFMKYIHMLGREKGMFADLIQTNLMLTGLFDSGCR